MKKKGETQDLNTQKKKDQIKIWSKKKLKRIIKKIRNDNRKNQ